MKNKKRWKLHEQAKLFKRLGLLLNRGYSLATAIEFLCVYVNDEKKKDLQFILRTLKQGAPFFNTFQTLQFSKEGLSYIYFAEKYGDLAKGLFNAGNMLEMKEKFRKNTEKVIRYPLFLLFLLMLIIAAMQEVLVPQFIQLYQSMSLPQSKVISMIISIQSSLPFIVLMVFIVIILLSIAYFLHFRKKTAIGKYSFFCKFPLIRYVVKKYNTYFFSFHFGNLLENGLSINDALSVFIKQGHIPFFQEEGERIREFLLEGDDLATIIKNTVYYDKELATVIIHGQANGILSKELLEYSSLVLDEFEETFTFWLRILQPTMISLIGIFIITLYISIMLPIYGMMQSL
ncbi:competence type IV pilus assembly protein ComGB [Schinkia sp. CFF1]